jgi:uncharacterized protein DUF4383
MPGWNGTLAQRTSLGLAVFFTVLGIIGLIVNSDFGTGSAVNSDQFLIDWNGWHAASTLLLAVIAFLSAAKRRAAVAFLAWNGVANVAESVWAMIDSTPLGILDFPNVATDVALHLVVTVVSLAGLFVQLARDRAAGPRPARA